MVKINYSRSVFLELFLENYSWGLPGHWNIYLRERPLIIAFNLQGSLIVVLQTLKLTQTTAEDLLDSLAYKRRRLSIRKAADTAELAQLQPRHCKLSALLGSWVLPRNC